MKLEYIVLVYEHPNPFAGTTFSAQIVKEDSKPEGHHRIRVIAKDASTAKKLAIRRVKSNLERDKYKEQ